MPPGIGSKLASDEHGPLQGIPAQSGAALCQQIGAIGAVTSHLFGIGRFGEWLIDASPKLIKGLGILGTVAMFLVGGGIFSHNIPWVEHLFEGWAALTGPLESVMRLVLDVLLGAVIGAIIVAIFRLATRLTGQNEPPTAER